MSSNDEVLVGIDDTDLIDTPGTNKLALHLVEQLREMVLAVIVTRHQLLMDARVPCTRKNGCAAIRFQVLPGFHRDHFIERIRSIMMSWCPQGADPGLCIASVEQSESVKGFGRDCQNQLMTQAEAHETAQKHRIYLQGLGGTNDGVIGALAAVGLQQSGNDGRVIYAQLGSDLFTDIGGVQDVSHVLNIGVDDVRHVDTNESIRNEQVDLGKKLRANLRAHRVVLFVREHPKSICKWQAVKLT